MDEHWDSEFLETLDKYAYKINEHKLIESIRGAIALALYKQIEEFESMVEQCMTFSDGNKIDKQELRDKFAILGAAD